MRPVLVYWQDAATESHMNWEPRTVDPMSPAIVQTVGFLLHETPQAIELCMSFHDDELAGRWMIPRCCIVSIHDLRPIPAS